MLCWIFKHEIRDHSKFSLELIVMFLKDLHIYDLYGRYPVEIVLGLGFVCYFIMQKSFIWNLLG